MKRLAVVLALVLASATAGPAAWAAFQQSASASSGFATASLAPASALTATRQCGVLQYEIRLSWTATPSAWADGYEVSMATSAAGPYAVVPLPAGGNALATTRTVGLLAPSTTYWFRVTATKGSWRSSAVQASATTSLLCVV